MAVKCFLRNFQFSAYYKLLKLTFSEIKRNVFFSEKVHSDVGHSILKGIFTTGAKSQKNLHFQRAHTIVFRFSPRMAGWLLLSGVSRILLVPFQHHLRC